MHLVDVCIPRKGKSHLRRSNIFTSALDTSRFNAALGVNAHIPRIFDVLLYLEYGGQTSPELISAVGVRTVDVRNHHLYVAIAAETTSAYVNMCRDGGKWGLTTFFLQLRHVLHGGVAEIRIFCRPALPKKLFENVDHP